MSADVNFHYIRLHGVFTYLMEKHGGDVNAIDNNNYFTRMELLGKACTVFCWKQPLAVISESIAFHLNHIETTLNPRITLVSCSAIYQRRNIRLYFVRPKFLS